MEGISDPAKAILGCLWINPGFTLRYGMQESVPSPQAAAALAELVGVGILAATPEPMGAVVYSLTAHGRTIDRKPKGGMAFIKKHGSFPLSVPKP